MGEEDVDVYFEDEAIQDQILVGRHVGWLQLAILAMLVQLERDVTAELLRFNPSMSKWRKRDIAAAISSTNKIVLAAYADIAAGVDLVGVASIVAEKVARETIVAEKAFGNVVVPPTQEVIGSIAKKCERLSGSAVFWL